MAKLTLPSLKNVNGDKPSWFHRARIPAWLLVAAAICALLSVTVFAAGKLGWLGPKAGAPAESDVDPETAGLCRTDFQGTGSNPAETVRADQYLRVKRTYLDTKNPCNR